MLIGSLAGAVASTRGRATGAAGSADTQALQAALDRRGTIRLTRTYLIDAPLTIHGGTRVLGDPGARIVWIGPPRGPILRDSSVVDPRQVNRDITLEAFEVAGGDVADGDPGQIAIEFYRTGNVVLRRLTVHGVGGSGIRWGNSFRDTSDILVEDCRVFDCRTGDAIQGSGRRVTVRNNVIGGVAGATIAFGDTGIALLTDFNELTNPHRSFSQDVRLESNQILGDQGSSGSVAGKARRAQTGIAFGPFAPAWAAGIRVLRNTIGGCHVSLWGVAMTDVDIDANEFRAHAARDTANVRLDGISKARVRANRIALSLPAAGPDYAALMLSAGRNVFGNSVFDADVSGFAITGNVLSSDVGGDGIRLGFGQVTTGPDYIARLGGGLIDGNDFRGFDWPVAFAPQQGEGDAICTDVIVSANRSDARARAIVRMAGNPGQYNGIHVTGNSTATPIPDRVGTGARG